MDPLSWYAYVSVIRVSNSCSFTGINLNCEYTFVLLGGDNKTFFTLAFVNPYTITSVKVTLSKFAFTTVWKLFQNELLYNAIVSVLN